MIKSREFYADGIENLHYASGIVRMDFQSLTQDKDNKSFPEWTCRIVTSPAGFMSMLQIMQQLGEKLIASGAVVPANGTAVKS